MSQPQEILAFWIDEIGPEGWYRGDAALDDEIRGRFLDLWQAAHAGGLDHWQEGAAPSLAFVVLTDQFPRNMFRGDARAFATDTAARAAAAKAIAANWDLDVPEPERQFFYLPFMHSERLADQDAAIEWIAARMPETGAINLLHARAHREVIHRFGRFPFRNRALGRESAAAEIEFLEQGGYRAVVEALKAAGD